MFMINYFMKMVIGNAIRLQTFSLVNLTASDSRGFFDPNFFASWIVSLGFTVGFMTIAIYNIYLVEKTAVDDLSSLPRQNIVIESLFTGLKCTKQAQRFWAYFIVRRFLIAVIAVFLKDYQSF
jgi:hypothetical protein